MKKGLTLIELLIVILLFIILTGVIAYVFHAALITWSSQEKRSGIDIALDRAIEELARDLREARQVQSQAGSDEIRFTQDGTNFYIYYFYNANDSYQPAFNQSSYDLKKAALTGGINGTFTYGSGQVIIGDAVPPATSDLSLDGNIITIDLSVKRADETIRSRTKVLPRNT